MTKRERKYLQKKKRFIRGYQTTSYIMDMYDGPVLHSNYDEPFYNFAMMIPKKARYLNTKKIKAQKYGGKHWKHLKEPTWLKRRLADVKRFAIKNNVSFIIHKHPLNSTQP